MKYHGTLLGLPRREIRAEVDKLLVQLELKEAADRACHGFSQGMKQRLALGIALLNDPRVLLLDEPSNGLDPIGIVRLRDLLLRLRDSGATILISSHRLQELEKLTSHYIFLRHGAIVPFDSRVTPKNGRYLRIGFEPNGTGIAKEMLPSYEIVNLDEGEITLRIDSKGVIPEIVSDLVNRGVRIRSVIPEDENVEDMFLRLCDGRTQ